MPAAWTDHGAIFDMYLARRSDCHQKVPKKIRKTAPPGERDAGSVSFVFALRRAHLLPLRRDLCPAPFLAASLRPAGRHSFRNQYFFNYFMGQTCVEKRLTDLAAASKAS